MGTLSFIEEVESFLNESPLRDRSDFKSLISSIRKEYPQVKIDAFIGNNGIISISRIVVPKKMRNQGIGEGIMMQIHEFADQRGSIISLTPSSDFGGSKAKLERFYKRLGYLKNYGRNKNYEISDSMYRIPKGMEE